MIEEKMITYYEFAQKVFIGKELYNKKTGRIYMKWEAFVKMKYVWEAIVQDLHTEFGSRDKEDWRNGRYTGKNLRAYQNKPFKR